MSDKSEVGDFEDCSLSLFLDLTGEIVLTFKNITVANDSRILSV